MDSTGYTDQKSDFFDTQSRTDTFSIHENKTALNCSWIISVYPFTFKHLISFLLLLFLFILNLYGIKRGKKREKKKEEESDIKQLVNKITKGGGE
jgi:amino acid transporter